MEWCMRWTDVSFHGDYNFLEVSNNKFLNTCIWLLRRSIKKQVYQQRWYMCQLCKNLRPVCSARDRQQAQPSGNRYKNGVFKKCQSRTMCRSSVDKGPHGIGCGQRGGQDHFMKGLVGSGMQFWFLIQLPWKASQGFSGGMKYVHVITHIIGCYPTEMNNLRAMIVERLDTSFIREFRMIS